MPAPGKMGAGGYSAIPDAKEAAPFTGITRVNRAAYSPGPVFGVSY